MKRKHFKTSWLKSFCLLIITYVMMTVPSMADTLDHSDSSIARGGRLYSDWMVELEERAPMVANPAYHGIKITEKDSADSWRCVSCHGWNYKGANGVKGILQKNGEAPLNIVKILKDKNHVYQTFLEKRDLHDLAGFVSKGLVHMDQMVDAKTRKAKVSGLKQRPFFETVCAMCHGAEGQSLAGISLGRIAREAPYLTLHSIFNGHPGAVMPSLRGFENVALVELLAYMQTLPVNASLVSIVRGARLYDNWALETGKAVPQGRHPSYPKQAGQSVKPHQTWQCRECHGWDYLGREGQYAKGKHFSGIKGIEAKKGASLKSIITLLKDENHNYGRVLEMPDLLDIANFVREGQVDMIAYLQAGHEDAKDASHIKAALYPTLCGNCHGGKGRAIRTMGALGHVANNDPWKALHKILNGHPAEEMPAWRSLDPQIIRDLMTYIQTLPQKKRS